MRYVIDVVSAPDGYHVRGRISPERGGFARDLAALHVRADGALEAVREYAQTLILLERLLEEEAAN